MIDFQRYYDEKILQLRVVCRSQWEYLNFSDLTDWIEDNFGNDIEGKYYAIKILLNTLYYKKKDLESLLKYGLYEKIYGEIIKEEFVSKSNIYIGHSQSLSMVEKLKDSTFFIPLLDSDLPCESGNPLIGDLVHKLNISTSQVSFHWDLKEEKFKNISTLVIVDDCAGSGNQIRRFWNSNSMKRIKQICIEKNIAVYFLLLLGYDVSIDKLRKSNQFENINIVVCEILTDKNRIFSESNILWDRETDERELAIAYFEKIRKERGVSFLGFQRLDFAVILNNRLPNWSLPIFWKESPSWKNLIKRKTS